MMTARTLVRCSCAAAFFAHWVLPARAEKGAAGDDASWPAVSAREKNGWIFVHLEGTPEQVGYQHGYLLADEIADLLRVVQALPREDHQARLGLLSQAAEQMLWKGIEPEYQREIDGIVAGLKAKGVKADRWDLVALNALEELPYYYVPWLDKKEGKTPTTHAPGNCTRVRRHGLVHEGRPDRHGAQCLDQLRRRERAGTSSSTSSPSRVLGCSWTGCPG